MNILIVLGLCLDLAGAILLSIYAFTGKDRPAGENFTFRKVGTLLLTAGFFLQLIAFVR
ncbi:MAG: hypothetical protein WC738_01295 [Candidatus Omnitrophota bacterium]|jgi:hypothetical protein